MWKSRSYLKLCWVQLNKNSTIYNVCLNRRIATAPVLFQHQKTVHAHIDRPPGGTKRSVGPMGWFLLLIPFVTLGLGTWQVKRRKWKKDLIAQLECRVRTKPASLPYDLTELEDLEYCPVRVRGSFDHSQELFLGPRSLIRDGDAASQAGLLSRSASNQSGYCVITPFHLADRDLTILVNRGWVSTRQRNPNTRQEGQVEGEVELVGVVRLNETRAPFTPQNQHDTWFYRDLTTMAQATGAAPVFLDATEDSTVPSGPIGGQTRVTLRNEHMSYILTWYGLSAITGIMWYRHFILKIRMI